MTDIPRSMMDFGYGAGPDIKNGHPHVPAPEAAEAALYNYQNPLYHNRFNHPARSRPQSSGGSGEHSGGKHSERRGAASQIMRKASLKQKPVEEKRSSGSPVRQKEGRKQEKSHDRAVTSLYEEDQSGAHSSRQPRHYSPNTAADGLYNQMTPHVVQPARKHGASISGSWLDSSRISEERLRGTMLGTDSSSKANVDILDESYDPQCTMHSFDVPHLNLEDCDPSAVSIVAPMTPAASHEDLPALSGASYEDFSALSDGERADLSTLSRHIGSYVDEVFGALDIGLEPQPPSPFAAVRKKEAERKLPCPYADEDDTFSPGTPPDAVDAMEGESISGDHSPPAQYEVMDPPPRRRHLSKDSRNSVNAIGTLRSAWAVSAGVRGEKVTRVTAVPACSDCSMSRMDSIAQESIAGGGKHREEKDCDSDTSSVSNARTGGEDKHLAAVREMLKKTASEHHLFAGGNVRPAEVVSQGARCRSRPGHPHDHNSRGRASVRSLRMPPKENNLIIPTFQEPILDIGSVFIPPVVREITTADVYSTDYVPHTAPAAPIPMPARSGSKGGRLPKLVAKLGQSLSMKSKPPLPPHPNPVVDRVPMSMEIGPTQKRKKPFRSLRKAFSRFLGTSKSAKKHGSQGLYTGSSSGYIHSSATQTPSSQQCESPLPVSSSVHVPAVYWESWRGGNPLPEPGLDDLPLTCHSLASYTYKDNFNASKNVHQEFQDTFQSEMSGGPLVSGFDIPRSRRVGPWGNTLGTMDSAVQAVNDAGVGVGEVKMDMRVIRAMEGVWHIDRDQSDCVDDLCELMQFSNIMTKFWSTFDSMEIVVSNGMFKTTSRVLGVYERFEEVPLNGNEIFVARSDMQKGRMSLRAVQRDRGLRTYACWGEPHAGCREERYWLDEGGDRLWVQMEYERQYGACLSLRVCFWKSD